MVAVRQVLRFPCKGLRLSLSRGSFFVHKAYRLLHLSRELLFELELDKEGSISLGFSNTLASAVPKHNRHEQIDASPFPQVPKMSQVAH